LTHVPEGNQRKEELDELLSDLDLSPGEESESDSGKSSGPKADKVFDDESVDSFSSDESLTSSPRGVILKKAVHLPGGFDDLEFDQEALATVFRSIISRTA